MERKKERKKENKKKEKRKKKERKRKKEKKKKEKKERKKRKEIEKRKKKERKRKKERKKEKKERKIDRFDSLCIYVETNIPFDFPAFCFVTDGTVFSITGPILAPYLKPVRYIDREFPSLFIRLLKEGSIVQYTLQCLIL